MAIKRATGAFLDAVGQELAKALGNGSKPAVSWRPAEPGPAFEDLHWRAARFRDGEDWIFTGAAAETWTELASDPASAPGDNFGALSACIEKLLSRELGPGKVLNDETPSSDVPRDGTSVSFEIQRHGSAHTLFCVLAPGLETALTESDAAASAVAKVKPAKKVGKQPAAPNALEMLGHVEVPVSVSFGSTRVRMRDLWGLTPGSVVELDQALGAQVDVRVNDCLIARGEVVAVDGNYAVRVQEIISQKYASALNGSTK